MEPAIPGPPPTRIIFLSQIPACPLGYKVRFLGCVSKYNATTGRLTLEHNCNVGGVHSRNHRVEVDINLLLGDINHTSIQIGVWLNVLGYIREDSFYDDYRRNKDESISKIREQKVQKTAALPVYIQAVMILPAGSVRIGEYEKVLDDMQQVERRINDE
ncbi:conserved hypothetical protein [Microsporum canis CBS 113480]|uniref:CST complex subunit Ten1 n=1 Tax=Arthroderma otae (strain ATCC MYA-4605 / CBS 113480) TaxID=554155 RepID=C5FV87_ARTOC|nr:conserved hypothetical protein [Microsporum canis CBS 113480]EEQ33821.1 conserved hypothetical protein [Microsporum canis CBS 113480]